MSSPLSPPDASELALVLKAPDAPDIVVADDAPGMVPVPAERQQEIARQAREFVADVSSLDPRTPEFSAKIEGISALASAEMVQSSGYSTRMLERSSTSVAGAKRSGNSA